MTGQPQFDLCPETGLGCVLVNQDSGTLKIDLMPDEAVSFQELVKSGDLEGAKALLVGVDSEAAALRALAAEMG